MKKAMHTININKGSISIDIGKSWKDVSKLRDKLWRADKIRIQGYTYSEWKETLNG